MEPASRRKPCSTQICGELRVESLNKQAQKTAQTKSHRLKSRSLKIGVASLAYLPMLLILLSHVLDLSVNQGVLTGCIIFNFPAMSLLRLIQGHHLGHAVEILSALLLMLSWSSLVAWMLWKIVGTFQGDDEPDEQRGQYDWVGFQVRFFIGFVVGFLCGWRFVKNTTSMQTLLIASIITGCLGGLIYGLTSPPDFWSRP